MGSTTVGGWEELYITERARVGGDSVKRQVVSVGGPTRVSAILGGHGRIYVAQKAKVEGDNVVRLITRQDARHNEE